MITLLERTQNLKIVHLEDDEITQVIVEKFIKFTFKNIELTQHALGINLYEYMTFEKPDIFIVDWTLTDCCAEELLVTLKRFKGLVIIYTATHDSIIYSKIRKKLNVCPYNFVVIEKGVKDSHLDLMQEIRDYGNQIDKDI